MKELLGEEWYEILKQEFDKNYIKKLQTFVLNRRQQNIVYPDSQDVFNAFKYTSYDKVKVCIIGQDPYINPNEAHGVAFSTKQGTWTPSLRKIHESIENEFHDGLYLDWNNNLTRWTEQGVFLLNTVLTVDKGKSNSHAEQGWEVFTLEAIKQLDKRSNIIFLLWGKQAQEYDKYITKGVNTVISCEHPVYAARNSRKWENNSCFIRVNNILKQLGEKEIIW